MTRRETAASEQALLAAARLTERQTACLAMHLFDGMSHGEIAWRLCIDRRVVTKHIAAAERRLARAGLSAARVKKFLSGRLDFLDPDRLDEVNPCDVRGIW